MKKKAVDNKSFRSAAVRAVVFAVALILSGTAVFAWFSNYRPVADNKLSPGKLDPSLEIYAWNKAEGRWSGLISDGKVTANLGEMTDITRLPEDCETYLKIKVREGSKAKYNYIAYFDDINIEIIPKLELTFDPPPIEGIDYYGADPSQKCFLYSYAVGEDNLNALSIEFGDENQIAGKGQALTGESLVGSDKWLYIKITPALTELQNIFKCISMEYMPYTIRFTLTIKGESRTADNEG